MRLSAKIKQGLDDTARGREFPPEIVLFQNAVVRKLLAGNGVIAWENIL